LHGGEVEPKTQWHGRFPRHGAPHSVCEAKAVQEQPAQGKEQGKSPLEECSHTRSVLTTIGQNSQPHILTHCHDGRRPVGSPSWPDTASRPLKNVPPKTGLPATVACTRRGSAPSWETSGTSLHPPPDCRPVGGHEPTPHGRGGRRSSRREGPRVRTSRRRRAHSTQRRSQSGRWGAWKRPARASGLPGQGRRRQTRRSPPFHSTASCARRQCPVGKGVAHGAYSQCPVTANSDRQHPPTHRCGAGVAVDKLTPSWRLEPGSTDGCQGARWKNRRSTRASGLASLLASAAVCGPPPEVVKCAGA